MRFKPFSITPLFREDGKVLLGSKPHVVEAGSKLWFRLSIAVDDVSILEKIGFGEIEVRPNPSSRFLLAIRDLEVISIDSLSIGLDGFDKVVRIRFLSPALLSTKLMAPPLPHFLKRVEKIRERYVLYPSSAHICSYLTKLFSYPILVLPQFSMANEPSSLSPVGIGLDSQRRCASQLLSGLTNITSPIPQSASPTP